MDESRDERKLMVAETIGKAFGIIMVVLYFILGTTFIFYTPDQIPGQYAKPFGILLIVYGLFRAYKLYRKFFV